MLLYVKPRLGIFHAFGLGGIIILILIRIQYKHNKDYQQSYTTHKTPTNNLDTEDGTVDNVEDINRMQLVKAKHDGLRNIENILKRTRTIIKSELWNYNFTFSEVQKLEDLLMEVGGKPVINLIVSTLRSGSSFLGELLNAMPSNFYNYEPLQKYAGHQIRGPPYAEKAISELKSMLRCDYSGMEDYFKYAKIHIKANIRLWNTCKYNTELCFDGNFTSKLCKMFPFQSMKLVRLRLHLVKDILEDTELNLKVVFLIRDPRAVMQSRRDIPNFCTAHSKPAPDCSSPELVCADMVSDYAAARRLSQEYPGRITVLRFEDLALNLNTTTLQLLKFLRLGATQSINKFLQTHTNVEANATYSTFRVTRDVPFKWKTVMDFHYVEVIQEACKEAMGLWGFKLAHNATHMSSKDFYPLRPYTL